MSDPAIRRVKETRCLACDTRLDAIGAPGEQGTPVPDPGDPVACIRCGAVMTYENGALRGFTEKEMDELERDPEAMSELGHMVKGIRFLKYKRDTQN